MTADDLLVVVLPQNVAPCWPRIVLAFDGETAETLAALYRKDPIK